MITETNALKIAEWLNASTPFPVEVSIKTVKGACKDLDIELTEYVTKSDLDNIEEILNYRLPF